jgi:hypothetical protein
MIRATLFCLMMCPVILRAQLVASTAPEHYQRATRFFFDLGLESMRVQLPHNSPEQIRTELLDEAHLRRIGTARGLSATDLGTVRMVAEPGQKWIGLYQLGTSTNAYEGLRGVLSEYIRAREVGHTKEFMLAAVSNRMPRTSIDDKGLRAIAYSSHLIPPSWLELESTGTTTNATGSAMILGIITDVVGLPKSTVVRKWASYILVDGDLCWRYVVQFNPDGSVDYVDSSVIDAKEVDPKYKAVIEEVDKAVGEEMEKVGSARKIGSCHRYWGLKKEKLREKGIDWRSPSEINPNILYD